ncbi:hypothetical protein HanRHA438_Chr05g0212291 [Helianthus annuus]|nr:hypothetical protein HanRHA438_Chr05g0212291 [Helianthus annuus]
MFSIVPCFNVKFYETPQQRTGQLSSSPYFKNLLIISVKLFDFFFLFFFFFFEIPLLNSYPILIQYLVNLKIVKCVSFQCVRLSYNKSCGH